ncbi:MAG: AI-2E family transporter [Bdellovibrio sp.]|nr:AI-2E family transporter [Bdellovibrio sp.]
MIEALRNKSVIVSWVLLLVLASLFVFINWPFLVPLVLAGIFALGLVNLVTRLTQKLHLPRGLTSTLVVLVGSTVFWLPLALAIYRISVHLSAPQQFEASHAMFQIQSLKTSIVGILKKITDVTGIDFATPASSMFESVIKNIGQWFFTYSSQVVSQLPGLLFQSFIFVLFLVALLWKAQHIKDFVVKYSLLDDELTENLILVAKDSCSITLFSTFVIGVIQASLIGLGALCFGEGDFWLVVTITFVVSFIPIIGAAPVGFVLALLAFIGDRIGAAIGMAVVASVAGTIDNILKPFLAGGKGDNKISPLIGFTCVVGAVVMFGISGLLLGPVIMNLVYGATPLLLKHLKQERT